MDTADFYAGLAPFADFSSCPDLRFYRELPPDWVVVITDIEGSTKAIKGGRYKDVNTLGAATIVATTRALGGGEFPFVFGGDGSTLLLPASQAQRAIDALVALKRLAYANYALNLRVGVVPMTEITRHGGQIMVGKLEITPGRAIALLQGGGLTLAEQWVKGRPVEFEARPSTTVEADLSGLSCRWHPIPAKRGTVLSLIVQSLRGPVVYRDFLGLLERIFPDGIESANPIDPAVATYRSVRELVGQERRLHSSSISIGFWLRCLEIFAAVGIFKHRLNPLLVDARSYTASMRGHSDFRKLDDNLRLVIDCDPTQVSLMKAHLESGFAKGDLFFGSFESSHSLMTCFLDRGMAQGGHIHFVDGFDGGYAMAASALKAQRAQAAAPASAR
jgi:hypothetical protein